MPTDLCVYIHTLYIKTCMHYVCGYRYGAHTYTDNFWYSEQLQTTGIISPYYRWGNWGSGGLRRVYRVTLIISLSPGQFPCCHCWVTTDAAPFPTNMSGLKNQMTSSMVNRGMEKCGFQVLTPTKWQETGYPAFLSTTGVLGGPTAWVLSKSKRAATEGNYCFIQEVWFFFFLI